MNERSSNNSTETLLDERLRRLMQPPPAERLAKIAERAILQAASAPPPARRRFGRLAVAAAVAGGLVGVWLIAQNISPNRPRGGYQSQPFRAMQTVYDDLISEGFQPLWVCKDDQEFADSFRSVHHQALLLAEMPPGTTTLGLSYCNTLTARTTCLLATAGGEPVVVFVDRIERDYQQPIPEGLRLHRKEIDRLVLYELSPLEEPAVLPWFFNPDKPDAGDP
jgi:hypothetical protein